jgi:CHAT domain-containing protein
VPNLTILSRLLSGNRPKRRIERFVGVGDPDGSLPSARAEIERAASLFEDSMTFLGEGFSSDAAKANLADADVAHISCHGFSFPENPDFSGLHLAGPAADPGIWWYYDVARFSLIARLVVLAACHAGSGSMAAGREYIGLPGAFLASGAMTVVAPLWAIDDRSTAVIMESFYPELLRTGSTARAVACVGSVGAAFQVFGLP